MITTCLGRGCHNLLLPRHLRGPSCRREVKWCSERCRKTKYSVPCVDCGTLLNGSGGRGPDAAVRCVQCANAHNGADRKIWTREAVVSAMREWAALYGEPPAEPDWNPHRADDLGDPDRANRFRLAYGRWPWFNTVFRAWGSWNAALVAAGFEPRPAHGGGVNVARRRNQRAKVAA
jgi:hypothetical protein